VALPELWSCRGLEQAYGENAEPVPGPTTDFLGGLVRELGVYVLGGSILEGEPGARRLFNTSTFFDPSGQLVAVYRKIHHFDVNVQNQLYILFQASFPCSARRAGIRGAFRICNSRLENREAVEKGGVAGPATPATNARV
jgi:predicted amidohydrolase